MSWLRSLLRLVRGRPAVKAPAPSAGEGDLRARVEAAIEADDADTLAALLRPERRAGKELIRGYAREIDSTEDGAARELIARRIAALVAVYERVLGDSEPADWFRRPGQTPRTGLADAKLRRAREAFATADFDLADRQAESGIDELHAEPDSPEVSALASTLLAVRGAVALRQERWAESQDLLGRSLETARASGRQDALAAALLNLIDLNTRRGRHGDADAFVEEAMETAPGTPFAEVLAKLLVERGVALSAAAQFPEAITSLDHANTLKPEWPFPLYQRGWARFLAGDSGGALEDYRECAARQPVFFTVQREIRCLEDVAAGKLPIEAYRSFCLVRQSVGDKPAEVEESAGRMTERFPEFAPAHLLRAEARLALRDLDGAREAARETLRRDPDPDTAAAALFFDWNVSRLRKEPDAAESAAKRLRSAYRDHPAAKIVERVDAADGRDLALRWTFAMDGTLHLEEVDPPTPPPDRTPPPPGSPG